MTHEERARAIADALALVRSSGITGKLRADLEERARKLLWPFRTEPLYEPARWNVDGADEARREIAEAVRARPRLRLIHGGKR